LTQAAEAERGAGIEGYATKGPPCSARAKASPEDFAVEEKIAGLEIVSEPRADYLPLYRVEKRSVDTMHMAKELSFALKSKVSYGGMKDKKAVAVQYVTPTSRRSERPPEVVRETFRATMVGFVPRPISRGNLVGNGFAVTLRGCCDEILPRIEEAAAAAEERKVPNFYGLQRFGTAGAGTHRIGRALVREEFKDAVEKMLLGGRPPESDEAKAAKEALAAGRFEEGARLLAPGKDIEKMVAKELGRHPNEWLRALRSVPVKLRRLYVQAYQSFLFNRTLSTALTKGEDVSSYHPGDNWAEVKDGGLVTSQVHGVRELRAGDAVPMVQIVGYAFRDYGSRFDSIVKDVLSGEGVEPRMFFVKSMQEASSEGGFRRPHLALQDASWSLEDRTASLRFALGKGQYATTFLREIIKPSDIIESGLV